MRTFLLSALLAAAVPARAADGLPSFGYTGASTLRRVLAEAPATPDVPGRAADVVTRRHMHVQAGRDSLFGYADTPEEFAEVTAYVRGMLLAAGVEPGTPELKSGMFVFPYKAPAGKVIRGFMADPKQFPPKDEPGLRANMALAQKALADAGMPLVSARVLNLEYILPTYSLLYLTDRKANESHEVRLRLLNAREASDFDVFRAAGLRVVQVPKPWMMVYVGPEAGVVNMGAKDEESARKKLAERREHFVKQGKTILAERVTPVEDPNIKFVVSLYFLH